MANPTSQTYKYDEDLAKFFTDAEELISIFREMVTTLKIERRLLIIHGVGGIGKSSVLRMFRMYCRQNAIPVTLASGDEAKSAIDILARWAEALIAQKIPLKSFVDTYKQYCLIQAKMEEQARKAKENRNKAIDTVGKAAAKTLVEVALSTIPVIGPIASPLGGNSAEALVDWMRGFLSVPEIDLALEPDKLLSAQFSKNITKACKKQRVVLMLDTFEQMAGLEDWILNMVQSLDENILWVLAGRTAPNWGRKWPGWLAQAHVYEMQPMGEPLMCELVNRYYAHIHGAALDHAEAKAIVQFGRGLPVVVNSAVRLWVEYGVKDFQAIKPEVMADLVERLLEGFPTDKLPLLYSACVLRWFNLETLQAISEINISEVDFNELKKFPFVRPHQLGMVIHDAVRDVVIENLQLHQPNLIKTFQKRAVKYFTEVTTELGDEIISPYRLAFYYHSMCLDEKKGLGLIIDEAESLARKRMKADLKKVVNDANNYPWKSPSSKLWLEYYRGRLIYLEQQLYQDVLGINEKLLKNPDCDPRLISYICNDLGRTYSNYEYLGQEKGVERAKQLVQRSIVAYPTDFHTISNHLALANIARYTGKWEDQIVHFTEMLRFQENQNDLYGIIDAYNNLKKAYARRGIFKGFLENHEKAIRLIEDNHYPSVYLKGRTLSEWGWAWGLAGRYQEGESNIRQGIELLVSASLQEFLVESYRDLGWALSGQHKFPEAEDAFQLSITLCKQRQGASKRDIAIAETFLGLNWAKQGRLADAENIIGESLSLRISTNDYPGMAQTLAIRGFIYELSNKFVEAQNDYTESLRWEAYGSLYFRCSSWLGLSRLASYEGIGNRFLESIQNTSILSKQLEYNDLLANLKLNLAISAWENKIPEWEAGFNSALIHFQQAIIYALRYNRFLLDEILWGNGVLTPSKPIIPYCLERGDEGLKMFTALCDWWQTGTNDIGAPRPDTVSPIPEGIPLLEAERIARQREPGDGLPQKTVIEQIEAAISNHPIG